MRAGNASSLCSPAEHQVRHSLDAVTGSLVAGDGLLRIARRDEQVQQQSSLGQGSQHSEHDVHAQAAAEAAAAADQTKHRGHDGQAADYPQASARRLDRQGMAAEGIRIG